MIRVGQIGLGHNHGAARMQTLRMLPELFQVVGFAPESEEWFEKRGSLPAYEGLHRLSREEVIAQSDAVLIETELPLLLETAIACVEAGKHILMDKPAGGTLEEFCRLMDLAEEKQLVVNMGYMYRYNPGVLRLLEALEEGKLGEIYSVNAEMSACDPAGYKKWLSQFHGGGMYIFGSHLLDLVVRLLGRPEKIHTFYKKTGKDDLSLSDHSLAVLEYPRALARIYTSAVEVNGYGRRQLVVSGSKGTMSILPLERPCCMTWSDTRIATHHHEDLKESYPLANLAKEERYLEEMRSFYDYVTGVRKDPWTYDHNRLVQELLLQIIGGDNGNGTD